jgi:hypothetical protein
LARRRWCGGEGKARKGKGMLGERISGRGGFNFCLSGACEKCHGFGGFSCCGFRDSFLSFFFALANTGEFPLSPSICVLLFGAFFLFKTYSFFDLVFFLLISYFSFQLT